MTDIKENTYGKDTFTIIIYNGKNKMSPLNNPFYIKGGMKSIKKTYINASSMNLRLRGLKARHLIGQSVRAVIR